jgi:hypothetical protein
MPSERARIAIQEHADPHITKAFGRPARSGVTAPDGQDLNFVVRRARQWCRCAIEECGEPGLAQMDIDLMGPDIDAVDQGSKEGTLSCSGQPGPALADFHGARDQPALR